MLSALPGDQLGARHGSPPARVVALHGWRRSHADFDRLLEGLDAVAPDLPGFGAAAPPADPWGAAEYARSVAPACEEREGAPVVVLGHSFGGKVAVLLAAERPELVKALVLTGTPLFRPHGQAPPRPSVGLRAAKLLNRAGVLSDARLEARRQRTGSEDYRRAVGVMRDVLVRSIVEVDDGTYRDALARIRCPVELVWGDRDTAAPPAMAQEAAELVGAAARLTILPGVGHMTPLDAPAALRDAVARHL